MKKIFTITWMLLFFLKTDAQQKFHVYYLTAASEHYEHDTRKFKEKNFVPYDNLPEATMSAMVITQLLQHYADGKGITLLSSDKNKMTKKRIVAGLDSIKKIIRRDNPVNPLIVFYYCGHGISENLGWNQFMIPGNYTSLAGNKHIDDLTKNLIFLGDITDKLDGLGYRYILLIDCCRKEGADNSLPEAQLRYFFNDQNIETFKTVVVALKILNEYHQMNPVIFSIAPGFSAPTVDLPDNEVASSLQIDKSSQVGPLCRRLLISVNDIRASKRGNVSLVELVSFLTSSNLDPRSPTSISFYTSEEDKNKNFEVFYK